MTNDKALEIAAELCEVFEGFSAAPYLCPAKKWTQGFGTVYKPDGSRVKETDPPISLAVAHEWLKVTLALRYAPLILKTSPQLLDDAGTFGAMLSFAYNLGGSTYQYSRLAMCINRQDWTEARKELSRWVHAQKVILRGLVARRAAEAALLPN